MGEHVAAFRVVVERDFGAVVDCCPTCCDWVGVGLVWFFAARLC